MVAPNKALEVEANGGGGGEHGAVAVSPSRSLANGLRQAHVLTAIWRGVVESILFAMEVNLQWHWLVLYAALLVPLSPIAKDAYTFYRATCANRAPAQHCMRRNFFHILVSLGPPARDLQD